MLINSSPSHAVYKRRSSLDAECVLKPTLPSSLQTSATEVSSVYRLQERQHVSMSTWPVEFVH